MITLQTICQLIEHFRINEASFASRSSQQQEGVLGSWCHCCFFKKLKFYSLANLLIFSSKSSRLFWQQPQDFLDAQHPFINLTGDENEEERNFIPSHLVFAARLAWLGLRLAFSFLSFFFFFQDLWNFLLNIIYLFNEDRVNIELRMLSRDSALNKI